MLTLFLNKSQSGVGVEDFECKVVSRSFKTKGYDQRLFNLALIQLFNSTLID